MAESAGLGERQTIMERAEETGRKWRTALHEAGHAVMAIVERRPFQDIVIGDTPTERGMVRGLLLSPLDDDQVRIHLGGIMSARLSLPRWHRRLFQGAHDDLGEVARFYRHRSDVAATLARNVSATASSLVANWSAVHALALRLERRGRATFDEALQAARTQASGLRPQGTLGARGWRPLVEHVLWRVRYPGGLRDALAAHGVEL